MSNIIRTYNQIGAELSAPGAIATNFPSCQFFLPLSETPPVASVTDLIAKKVWTVSVGTLGSTAAYSLDLCTPAQGANTLTASSGYPITTSPSLAFWVGYRDSSAINNAAIKNATASVYDFNLGDVILTSGVQLATCAMNLTEASIIGAGLGFKASANEATAYQVTTSTWTTPATANNDLITTLDDINTIVGITIGGNSLLRLYGVALFKFTTFPTDIREALSWMTYHWQNGNKWLYPGWLNRT